MAVWIFNDYTGKKRGHVNMADFKDNAQSTIIELETISPIHIRGRDIDFGEGMVVLNRVNDKLNADYAYLIDNDVLCDWLYSVAPENDKHKYINDYIDFFTGGSLDGFFKRYLSTDQINEFINKKNKLDVISKDGYLKTKLESDKDCFEHKGKYYKFKKGCRPTNIVNYFLKGKKAFKKNLLDDYYKQSLMLFLRDNKLLKKLEEIPESSKWYKIFKGRTYLKNCSKSDQLGNNYFIHNGEEKYYIPGSSIKGCFKTAVLYSILKRERDHKPNIFKERYEMICDSIEKIEKNKKKALEMRHCADKLVEKIFSDTTDVVPRGWDKHKPKKHNLDFFRCTHITDANIEYEQNIESKSGKQVKALFDTQSDVWVIKYFLTTLSAVKGTTQERETIHEDDIGKFKLSEGDRLSELTFETKGRHKRIARCVKLEGNKAEKPKKKVQQQTDPFQMETVGWTTLGKNNNMEIKPKPISKNNTKMLKQPVECFEGKTSFRVTIDMDLFNEMFPDDNDKPFNNIDDLLDIMKDFASDLWEEERLFFFNDISNSHSLVDISHIKKFYEKQSDSTMRIGWGTGLLGMTILSLFDKNNGNGIRKRVRDLTQPRENAIAPKSRRFVLDKKGIPFRPLGWCKLKVQSEVKMGIGDGNGK